MKKYIFLTFAVPGIGGTQIYARNKLLYLQKNGWDVIIITEEAEGEIVVNELYPYKDYIVPELIQSPYLLTRSKRKKVLDKLKEFIGDVDSETVIETNFIMATIWGELLAKEMSVKHFIFLIQEDYSLTNPKYLDYFSFKLDRGELYGNTPVAIKLLLEGHRVVEDSNDTYLSAYCSNTVEDCDSTHENCILDADYHIGSIGRINKPFVIPMVKDIVSFAKNHEKNTFQLIMLGGSPNDNDISEIKDIISHCKNISVYITGPIFPVPKKILDKIDVFVSSAGAAATSANLGYTTIVIDANDFMPIGVLGYTTNQLVHRISEEPFESTESYLEDILYKGKYPKKTDLNIIDQKEYFEAFDKHIKCLNKTSKEYRYYDIKKTAPNILSRILYFIKH